ncbi:MAG: 23S rRNA (adenine(1618)-N(6))-methyltransferase RlmF [Elusimicrobia bacterium]|nr:23S rRNA (adenine(1618)-N(6))-methyltransferase RlmF [Elusimicrobiota bacterium]
MPARPPRDAGLEPRRAGPALPAPRRRAPLKPGPHPRNRHKGRYDLAALTRAFPALAPFVATNRFGVETIDFAEPAAVKALNRALLKSWYGIDWDIPNGFLCPPIPGRADYLHHLADLLGGKARGESVRVLDVGVGANCVYPVVGRCEYGWSFVGSDIDSASLDAARRTVGANPSLKGGVELRLQASADKVFDGVIRPGDRFDACVCNPPFHASLADARAGSLRKERGLGRSSGPDPALNFGGRPSELVTEGGEAGFARRMAAESARFAAEVRWFTLLVSRESNLPAIRAALTKAGAAEVRVVAMGQGNKASRLVAWTFGAAA